MSSCRGSGTDTLVHPHIQAARGATVDEDWAGAEHELLLALDAAKDLEAEVERLRDALRAKEANEAELRAIVETRWEGPMTEPEGTAYRDDWDYPPALRIGHLEARVDALRERAARREAEVRAEERAATLREVLSWLREREDDMRVESRRITVAAEIEERFGVEHE